MKKIIIALILMLALLMSFVACSDGNTNENSNTEGSSQQTTPQPPYPEKTVYDTLNELSKQNYSKILLNITTLTGDIELGANYVLKATNITYSIEQLNLLPTDGDLSNTSSNYKSTIQGTATVENGKVTKLDNVEVDIPEYDELKGAFEFKDSYFKNIQKENGKFSADVISVAEFLGNNRDISNMKVIVEYNSSAFQKITITYKTTNSTVTTVYEFEK